MKYTFKISGTSQSGNPHISVHCEHCGLGDFHLPGHVYAAELKANPRTHLAQACEEFFERLNLKDNSLFKSPKTAVKIMRSLCDCDPKIVDIESVRAKKRAQEILRIALQRLDERDNTRT